MSKLLYIVGSIFLLHAGYSSFEFHQLLKTTHHSSTDSSLPSDIIIEVLVGIVVLIAGSLSSIEIPNFLSVDNEVIHPDHKYLKPIEMSKATAEFEKLKINPFAELETRIEFLDIVNKRKEYAQWSGQEVEEK